MTEGDGDSSSPDSGRADEPPPAERRAWPRALPCVLLPEADSLLLRGGIALPQAADLPLDAGLCITGGLALSFAGGLIEAALQKFSPALLLMRVEKQNGDESDGDDHDELERELQESEIYLAPALLLKFAGIGLALAGALALFDGATLWPPGWIGIAILFVLTILFSGMLPSRITDHRAEQIVYRTLPALRIFRILLLPVTVPVSKFSAFVVRNVLGLREETENAGREKLADEIRAAVEDSDETEELADEEKEWIENIVEFRKEDAAGIMTPRTDMVCVEAGMSFRDAVTRAVQAGHSRLPVFQQKMDNIIGIFYLRDAVGRMTEDPTIVESPVSEFMREAFFVPESKKVSNLLHEFKTRRVQIAVVVDEYGGTAGLVSIEDILEEIVGEIEDEYDPERENPLRILEDGRLAEVDAKVRIGDINEELGIELPDSEDYETVGGFVFSHLGHIPAAGESFQYGNTEITVMSADARKIGRLRIRVVEGRKATA